MNAAAVIRALRAKGMSDTDILDVIQETADSEILRNSTDVSAERRRAKDRERKRISAETLRNSTEVKVSPLSEENSKREEKREAKPKATAAEKRGYRIPADWMPSDDDAAFAATLGYTAVQYDREVLKFRNHWESAPGDKGRKLDWHKTFRNWLIRGAERLTPPRQLSIVPTTPTANAVFVLRGSPQWIAWTAHRGGREPIPKTETAGEGQWMRTEWPPNFLSEYPPTTEQAASA